MQIQINTLSTDMFLELYRSVGWEPPCREQGECALKNTAASYVAYEEEKAISMVIRMVYQESRFHCAPELWQ